MPFAVIADKQESVSQASAAASADAHTDTQDADVRCVCGVLYSDDEENTWIGCESSVLLCPVLQDTQTEAIDVTSGIILVVWVLTRIKSRSLTFTSANLARGVSVVALTRADDRHQAVHYLEKGVQARRMRPTPDFDNVQVRFDGEHARALLTFRFCSDLCAYQHFKTFAATISNKKTLNQIASSFNAYPRPANVQVTHHTTTPLTPRDPAETQEAVLATIELQLSEITSSLELVKKRQAILQSAIERSEAMSTVLIIPSDDPGGKNRKRKKGGGGGGEDKQCGWDKRLIWDDEVVRGWQETEKGDGPELALCSLPKKRCDRHPGWQKTIGVQLEVEQGTLVSTIPDGKLEHEADG